MQSERSAKQRVRRVFGVAVMRITLYRALARSLRDEHRMETGLLFQTEAEARLYLGESFRRLITEYPIYDDVDEEELRRRDERAKQLERTQNGNRGTKKDTHRSKGDAFSGQSSFGGDKRVSRQK